MALQERLQCFIKDKGLTPRLFENYAGLGNGSCAKLNAKSRKATFDRIANAFPTLNIDWLLTGEGEMLRP
ncbi:MAG: helix-turn-helix domain-containing protein, partial [Prevotellaceae bacterium]|nr:helix-turn-helix domain-containing protein [Prevotellaceae bacterium]